MTVMPPIAILAGGTATRLRPITATIPKAMVEVAGEPFIAHQLRLLRREGIERAVLLVGYLAEQIRAFVGDGARFGVAVDYVADGPKLLGTGGAIGQALPKLGPEFLVMYGDSWLDIPYAPVVEAFRKSGAPALMTVFANGGRWDRSNVWYEDGRILRYSKRTTLPQMQHIDWGLSVLKTEAVASRTEEVWDLAEMFEALSLEGRLAGYEVTTRFYEIGSFAGLEETDRLLSAAAPSGRDAGDRAG